ncbi:DNA mismatch repair protein MutS [Thermomicrobium sp. 4228-Ro]|uniref:DNA mismatch repair protein MutS n=1 Tax=Thermomicrobium sp. 4228-Ro TaxID=2993937 RepID=UPI0022488A7E|nr:DNA mismatch repair protein MutS [Thermomicrobium sp. 4228-Ro]MCX2727745.1 DNA mismatch repair protein MutS [Thermomicrobium sp. 4228-Ro]
MTHRTRAAQPSARSLRTGDFGDDLVPSRRQYLRLKAQYPNAILLYRLGDFYEAFDRDAEIVARDARITLTSRSFGRNGRVPMAGIPHHALNEYVSRLLAAGHTVAIAEQLSEPGKGLVERAVTRVLTPGTVAEAALLPANENRYLAAIAPLTDRIGLAWVDVSTGEFAALEIDGSERETALAEELARLAPAECLVPDDQTHPPVSAGRITRVERWHFDPDRAAQRLRTHFGTRTLAPFGCEHQPAATAAAGAILVYLERTNPALLPLLTSLRTELPGRRVGLDAATRRNLELTRSFRTGGTRASLIGVLDLTVTPMGARALRRLVNEPLRDLAEIQHRQEIVAALVSASEVRRRLEQILLGAGDLERLTSRIVQGNGSVRDFLSLRQALATAEAVIGTLQASDEPALRALAAETACCTDLAAILERAVVEDADGARIRPGFSPELDTALATVQQARQFLATLEQRERERTGIRSLKVGYNKVFGYYIEVTRPHLARIPSDYVRKQTIATGERFITPELKEAEARLLTAEAEIAELERAALARLTHEVTARVDALLRLAHWLARLDAFRSLAEAAVRYGWTRPHLDESDCLEIEAGRHPVVEALLDGQPFVPNDCRLGGEHPRIVLVTGPNMGGKSTYLRQVALIVLLAQIGSFVPARAARIGLVDRIFCRVGAHDDLPGGQSTFMVEMVETATILRQATQRSLVILDEVGRGTATQDGLAIARAVLEDLHHRVGARTLFATHFLELTTLADELPSVANAHVAAIEHDGHVVFLYRVLPGPADRAYGIHVARLAGLPSWVADRAESLLGEPPSRRSARPQFSDCRFARSSAAYQLALPGFPDGSDVAHALARDLIALDLTQISPRQALDWLFAWQARLRGTVTEGTA